MLQTAKNTWPTIGDLEPPGCRQKKKGCRRQSASPQIIGIREQQITLFQSLVRGGVLSSSPNRETRWKTWLILVFRPNSRRAWI